MEQVKNFLRLVGGVCFLAAAVVSEWAVAVLRLPVVWARNAFGDFFRFVVHGPPKKPARPGPVKVVAILLRRGFEFLTGRGAWRTVERWTMELLLERARARRTGAGLLSAMTTFPNSVPEAEGGILRRQFASAALVAFLAGAALGACAVVLYILDGRWLGLVVYFMEYPAPLFAWIGMCALAWAALHVMLRQTRGGRLASLGRRRLERVMERHFVNREGFHVFRDFPAPGGEIAAVMISPRGMFCLEVAAVAPTHSKDDDLHHVGETDGERGGLFRVNAEGARERLDPDPLERAGINAEFVRAFMERKIGGDPGPVARLVYVPGWDVKRDAAAAARDDEFAGGDPDELRDFLRERFKRRDELSEDAAMKRDLERVEEIREALEGRD